MFGQLSCNSRFLNSIKTSLVILCRVISARSDAREHLRQTLNSRSPFCESSGVFGVHSFSNAKPKSVDRGFSVNCTGGVDSSPLGLYNVGFSLCK